MSDRLTDIETRAERTAADPFFVADCEGSLQVWRESALTHVHRDETGDIDGYSLPSSYRATDQVIDIDLDSWDPGEDAGDDQRRQDIGDLVQARADEVWLLDRVKQVRRLVDEAAAGRMSEGMALVKILATLADSAQPDEDLRRRRIYTDGEGNGWVTHHTSTDGEVLAKIDPAALTNHETADEVRERTGGLRQIGRTW